MGYNHRAREKAILSSSMVITKTSYNLEDIGGIVITEVLYIISYNPPIGCLDIMLFIKYIRRNNKRDLNNKHIRIYLIYIYIYIYIYSLQNQ